MSVEREVAGARGSTAGRHPASPRTTASRMAARVMDEGQPRAGGRLASAALAALSSDTVDFRRRPACRARLEPAMPSGRRRAAAAAGIRLPAALPAARPARSAAPAAKPNCRRPAACSCEGAAAEGKAWWVEGKGREERAGCPRAGLLWSKLECPLTFCAVNEAAIARGAPLRHACCAVAAKPRAAACTTARGSRLPGASRHATASAPPAPRAAASTSPTALVCSDRCSSLCKPRIGHCSLWCLGSGGGRLQAFRQAAPLGWQA